MDTLDSILLEAWDRVGEKVRRERVEALKRSRRRFRAVLARPMREWCLVIRSSDTRINDYRAIIEPRRAIERLEPHAVTISGSLIRRLTRPVMIPWPGVTHEQAAGLCGREWPTIKEWIRKGVFRVDHYAEFKFPRTCRRGKDGAARGAAGRGGRPYVWTPSPIDPNNWTGRVPHPVWGTLWQWLGERFPENYELVVQREPRFRTRRDRAGPEFRGWEFICPGRLDERGEYKGCGRRCWYLYAPQTVWTLARALGAALGGEAGFDVAAEGPPEEIKAASQLALAGQWFPGLSDPVAAGGGGGRSFACKKCWGVRSMCNSNYRGWKDFVTQISGGLLYGREVPRPEKVCPIQRKHRPFTWRRTREALRAGAVREGESSEGRARVG